MLVLALILWMTRDVTMRRACVLTVGMLVAAPVTFCYVAREHEMRYLMHVQQRKSL